MTAQASNTWPHADLISDNKLSITELPQKTQDLIAKFASITDPDAQESMDEKIYGQIDDYLEDKAKKEKDAKTKEKVKQHKEKKAAAKIDVSNAATASNGKEGQGSGTPVATPAPEKKRSLLDVVYGRK